MILGVVRLVAVSLPFCFLAEKGGDVYETGICYMRNSSSGCDVCTWANARSIHLINETARCLVASGFLNHFG